MAAGYNTNFHREDALSSIMHRHAISFQSGAVNSTSEMIPIGHYHGMNASNGNLMYCDSSNTIGSSSPSTTTAGNSTSSLLLDSVPGLNHDASLAVEWTEEEQFKLEEGLVKLVFCSCHFCWLKVLASTCLCRLQSQRMFCAKLMVITL